jgi:hypothetical protein
MQRSPCQGYQIMRDEMGGTYGMHSSTILLGENT